MNQAVRLITVSVLIFVITACSGIQVSQDFEQGFDFSGLKTFAWQPNENNEWGLTDNDLVDRRIRNEGDLPLKGLLRNGQGIYAG